MHATTAQSQAKPHSHQHRGPRTPAATQSASAAKPRLYNPRHPERTLLYRTISENFETWLELASAGQFDGQGDHHTPRSYVRQAFRKYLECGIFAHTALVPRRSIKQPGTSAQWLSSTGLAPA